MKDQQQITLFNKTDLAFPKDRTIVDLFLDQVKQVPEHTAVKFKERELSYKELDAYSNQYAHYLINTHHIQKGDFVGLLLERSEWLIVTILGVLKAGAAYVPIATDYPEQRKSYIQKDSNCKLTVDAEIVEDFRLKREQLPLTLPTAQSPSPNSLLYIIYTSGTTGNPKGVMVEHRSVVNLITSQTQLFGIRDSESILQFSNYFFDASIEQFFLALLNGAALVIVGKEELKHHELPSFMEKHGITHLHATPSYLETLNTLSNVKTLKRIIAGGERCTLKLAEKLGRICDFYNEYGPTETTVTSTVYHYSKKDATLKALPIGSPIGNTQAHILSETLTSVPIGEVGELCLAGEGLARGYLNLPELTAAKFVDHPFEPHKKIYRTGDFAKWLPDGNIAFIGRKDEQIKIRGYRVELGEIEAALNALPEVKRATVVLSDYGVKEKRLVAYIQSTAGNTDSNLFRKQLLDVLPEYMVPSLYIPIASFPMTSNGKIDKKNLPDPVYSRPDSAPVLRKPRTAIQKSIAEIWSEQLGIPEIGIDDNFFEMGGTSLLTQKVAALLRQELKLEVPVTKIYQYPTISALLESLELNLNAAERKDISAKKKKRLKGDVAIIGMAGRFPGALSIPELWEVLREGRETISFFTPEELDKSIPESLRNDPLYVAARGIVPSAKEFDAKFFGINPKMAEAMDPQQRLFLEIAWEVLEQAGHLPQHYSGSIGVYAGSGTNTYYINNVLPNTKLVNQVGPFQLTTVNDKDYIASRIAYHLNLKGPAVSVHSACSTSLLAIAEAVEAIRNGQCDVALAGASSITSPMYSGHLYQEGSMLSANGHCRSFDAEGKGTVFSDGAGVVLLKGLEDAQKDGDVIHGIIKGIGVNNDGGNKGSFTAPSVEGQAGVIRGALADAGIAASDITYVEAHGTATPLGDPIEVEGLHTAFGEQPSNAYCALGSIKSNMGHLTAAAGVAGLIKTILAMKYGEIPPSLGFQNLNPVIDLSNSPFFVNQSLKKWEAVGPRKAGISSFGVGGTNVHLVVEEYKAKAVHTTPGRPVQLLTWSAKTENSVNGYKNALRDFMQNSPEVPLADTAYALHTTRKFFSHRSFVLADSVTDALENSLSKEKNTVKTNALKVVPNELAFLFPGQGSQYVNMGKALYDGEIVFREAVDQCATILQKELNLDIKAIIFPDSHNPNAEDDLKDTKFTQPALFVIEYALAQLWMSWGLKPTVLCGHSIGEFVAAHVAGIFTLPDALRLITIRGQLVSALPGGSMLSVRTTVDMLMNFLPDTLSIAAVNSDRLCVVSGPDADVENFAETLKSKSIAHMLLFTSHAFHSTMMDPVLEVFKKEVEKVSLHAPRLPMISTVTGTWLSEAEATSPDYWTNHLRATVRFSDAMETAQGLEDAILLEVGPGRALTTLAHQKKGEKSLQAIASLPIPKENENAYHSLLTALGQLWSKGASIDWKAFYKEQSREKVGLPSYVFDRKPCWIPAPSVAKAGLHDRDVSKTSTPLATPAVQTEDHTQQIPKTTLMRKTIILQKISEIIMDTSGIELEATDYDYSFLELGLDSLVLTQMSITCKNEFGIPITFRQLNDALGTPSLLAEFLDENLPAERYAPQQLATPPAPQTEMPQAPTITKLDLVPPHHHQDTALDLIAQQLQLLGKQIALLQGNGTTQAVPRPQEKISAPTNDAAVKILSEEEKEAHKKPFGAAPKIEQQKADISSEKQAFLEQLIRRYNRKTARSKAYSQQHRAHMADPRVVSGFKPLTKELVYPIVIEKSSGNRLWDLDGNEYIDTLNGFGSCLFGHQPYFIKEALHQQVDLGFEVGPQHPLAGEVCELLCEFTHHERAALCNTGSEAVLGAMRIARTVTGRSLIVAFSRSYHGINDEVIVRGSRKMRTFPAAPGILAGAVQNMLILDYGTEESLAIIRERAHELAAVLVEPVQSRRPEFQPIDFLKEVREITRASETVLIFDEIITGFRMHPGGAQALFGIKADVATYGKVIGGGISIGAILGGKKYMDALDGGFWQYGDDSFPEVGVTYFAGTFVRHPLALATTKASLLHMKEQGADLQEKLAVMTEGLATELNTSFKKQSLPLEITYYRSLWRLKFLEEIPYGELLFVLLREKGFHIWDGFPCYMTEAYNEEDIAQLINAFNTSIAELNEVGIFRSALPDHTIEKDKKRSTETLNQPPVPGARLGLDELGSPAWFIVDEKKDNEYIKIDL
ncbi:amino acid adenylation domain-containing protein [Spongiimicrobium salis]|uniref:amino acid adenylation domain-containing protein n=1 Tax=Spongiimicrobium salis TaxID=1667022 RepID=UPI00374C8A94